MQLYIVAAVVLWFSVALLHHFIAFATEFVLRSEVDFMLTGSLPAYTPSKFYVSADVVDEIENLQSYVGLSCVDFADRAHARSAVRF